MSATLPVLINEKRAIYDLLETTGGELDEKLERWLKEVDSQLMVKTDSYRIVLEELENDADRLRKKALDFTQAARTVENVVGRLKDRIKDAMQVMDATIIDGDMYRFKLSPGPDKLIVDENLLPTSYKIIKQELVIDKERIKADLAAGIEIPGAHEVSTVRLLPQIRKGK